MRTSSRLIVGALALGAAIPAAAQYNPYPNQPGYNYPAYPGQADPQQYPQPYPNNGYQPGYGNPVGQIIDQLLGNRYNVTERQAVTQCASAAISQASSQYGGQFSGQYRYNRFRVASIDDVQRRSNGLRVRGVLNSGGRYGDRGGNGYRDSALSFRCNVDYRGVVTNVRLGSAGYGHY
jgi:hypothetical protein